MTTHNKKHPKDKDHDQDESKPFLSPDPSCAWNKKSNLTYGTLTRDNSGSNIKFVLDQSNGPDKKKMNVVLSASRGPPFSRIKFDIKNANHQVMAQLVHVHSSTTFCSYAVMVKKNNNDDDNNTEEDVAIAMISYRVPPLLMLIFSRDPHPPPRQAELALPNVNTALFSDKHLTMMQKQGRLDQDKVCSSDLVLWKNKTPYRKSNGRRGLNFQGRGKVPSNKNMQFDVAAAGSSSTNTTTDIMLQMVKWEQDCFHVDYDPTHVSMLQAFGFALAQLDL